MHMGPQNNITKFAIGQKSLDLNKVGPSLLKLLTKKVTIPASSLIPLVGTK